MRSIIESSTPTKVFILGSFLQIAGNLVGGKQMPSLGKKTDRNIATNHSQVAGAAIGALGESMQSLAITVPSLPMLYRWYNAVPLTGNVTSRKMENLGKSVLLLGGVFITVAACILPIARRAYFLFLNGNSYDLASDLKILNQPNTWQVQPNVRSIKVITEKLFNLKIRTETLDISTKVVGGVFKLIHLAEIASHHDPLVALGAAAIQTATLLTIK